MLTQILVAYIAFYIVIVLHELGHVPETIKFRLLSADAVRAKFRIGGLVVNTILLFAVWYYKPESIILQLVGFFAWAHYILYVTVGSVLPEPLDKKRYSFWDFNNDGRRSRDEPLVDLNTYVFDDVDNKYWLAWWASAAIVFLMMKSYYIPIVTGLFNA